APRTVVVTSTVEHSATKQMCEKHTDADLEVRAVAVNDDGTLDMDALAAALDDEVALCTMLWANNETGVLFDVEAIAEACHEKGVPFHCDATQTLGKVPADFHALGVDMATIAAHKFYGPKGVGALFVRKGLPVDPLLIGGPQERARRGGTENVPGIVGLGKAAEIAKEMLTDMERVETLRDKLEAGVAELCGPIRINGVDAPRLPNTSNIGFEGLAAEAIVIALSEQGICISAGAACSSGSMEASHVIQNMRVPEKFAHGSVRFSLGRFNTDADVDTLLAILPGIVERLRSVMPVMA
ncbi:MAG: aminotransferase class V-fold PLP-dependent enzyme, partial [Planctomycetota bacterium]